MIQPDNMRNPNTGRRTMTVSAYNQANPNTQWGANTKAVIHGSSGKTYTLDQQTYDWVKSRNQQYWADSYGLDDADQLAKKNGQMSAAARKSYTNSKLDQQLFELGLPSEKNLEKVLAQYNQWHTGGMDQVFGKMNLPKDYWTKTKGWYQSDMQNAYENTAEDQQRKMRGLMPSKWEEKYTDTEIDDQLRARGLPPLSEFKTYANRYDSYQGINALYANVAGKQTNLRLQGIKDDDTEYDGVKGKDLYTAAFYDELERKNEDGTFVYGNIMDKFKNSAKPSSGTPTGDYAYDRGAAILTGNKDMASEADYDSYNAFSYDDYKKRYPEYYDRYYANAQTNSGQLVSDALAVQAREEDEEATNDFYDIDNSWFGDKGIDSFVTKYEKDYPENSFYDMFSDMYKHGASQINVLRAMKAVQDQVAKATGNNKDFYAISQAQAQAEADWAHTDELDALYGPNGYDVVKGRVVPKGAEIPGEGEAAKEEAQKTFFNFGDVFSDVSRNYDTSAEAARAEQRSLRNKQRQASPAEPEQVDEEYLSKVNDAIAVYESAVAAYEDTAGHGAPSAASREPINKANELLNSLGLTSIHAARRYVDSIANSEKADEELRKAVSDAIQVYDSAKADAELKGDAKSAQAVIDAEKKVTSLLNVNSAEDAREWLRTGELPGELSTNGSAVGVEDAIKIVQTYMEQNGGWNKAVATDAFNKLYGMGVSPEVVQQTAAEMNERFGEMEETFTEKEKKSTDELRADMDKAIEDGMASDASEATVQDTRNAIEGALIDDNGAKYGTVDGVIKVLDSIADKSFTNPTAYRLALADLGFTEDGFSGMAEDLTANWSDADKRKLAYHLGLSKLTDIMPEDIMPGFNRAAGDTLGDTWADPGGSVMDRRALKPQEFTHALKWAQQQIAAGNLTEGEAFDILASKGYQYEMQEYMPEEWHRAHFVEYVAPGLWAQAEESDRLLYEEMTPEEKRAANTAMWDGLTQEQKDARYGNADWWKYDPYVSKSTGQALEEQFMAILPGFAAEVIGGAVTTADAIDALITGRPEMWDATKNLRSVQKGLALYGSDANGGNGTQLIDDVASAAQELLSMSVFGTIGGMVGEAFIGTKVGGAIAKVASSDTKIVKGIADMFLTLVKSTPFMARSYASNYGEAKELGASNAEANWYATVNALTEGSVEGLNFDKIWSNTLGLAKFGELLYEGGRSFLEVAGIKGRALVSSMVSGFAGEALEEGVGYVVETASKMRYSDSWGKGTEWSWEDAKKAMLMGGLTGALGAGIYSGSLSTNSLIMDYARSSDVAFRKVFPDIAMSIGVVESMSEGTRTMYEKGGAKILSDTAYGEVLTQKNNLEAGIENAGVELEKTKAKLQQGLETQLREIDKKAAKGVSVDLDKAKNPKEALDILSKKCNELGVDVHDIDLARYISGSMTAQEKAETDSLLSQRAQEAVQRNKATVRNTYNKAVSDAEADYKAHVDENQNLIDGLANQLQEHWAGIYFANYDNIISGLTDEMVSNLAQAYQNGAKYEPGQAAEQQAAKPSKLAEAEANDTMAEAEQTAQTPEDAATKARELAYNRVYKDQEAGKAYAEGRRGEGDSNMTRVQFAENERQNFQAKTTARLRRVTLELAGLEAKDGMSAKEIFEEAKKAMTPEAAQKLDMYQKLSKALGLNMVVRDVVAGTSGYVHDGKLYVTLNGKQSMLRVASHELTHYMQGHASEQYDALRSHLVNEVGQERFDQMLSEKAQEYGLDLNNEKGRLEADDEVCAELCERMLESQEALERFVQSDLDAAKTLKARLGKTLVAIKSAIRSIGTSDAETKADYIKEQQTIEAWYKGLSDAIDNANRARTATTSTETATVADTTTEAPQAPPANPDLFMGDESARREQLRTELQELAKKGTKVNGLSYQEVNDVLERVILGDKSNYSKADLAQIRGMLAQLIPEVQAMVNGDENVDTTALNDRLTAALDYMLERYSEGSEDHYGLTELVPGKIALTEAAYNELRSRDMTLRQASNELRKALGGKFVSFVYKRSPDYNNAMTIDELWSRITDAYGEPDGYGNVQEDALALIDYAKERNTRTSFDDLYGSQHEDLVNAQVGEFLDAVQSMVEGKASEKSSTIRYMAEGTNLTEKEMENYVGFVSNALKGEGNNKKPSIRIGKVSPAVIEGLKRFGIYLDSNAYHELSDNNVRHIRDRERHGIEKVGPMGITDGDVYAIPYIIANADAAYYRKTKKGEDGVLYVMNDNDSTYYVEGISSDGVLTGRQMMKAPRGTIPSEYVNDVQKEKALTASPDDLKIPGAYVQDATRSRAFEEIIPSMLGEINPSTNFSLDDDYMPLAEKYDAGVATDEEIAEMQRDVNEAAASAGFPATQYDPVIYDANGNVVPLSERFSPDFTGNRYTLDNDIDELIKRYGAIEQGREPRARDVQVPRQTNDMNRVSQWIRSLIESGKLTDEQAQNVLRMVVEQDYGTYIPTTQAERMEEARTYIAERQPLQAQQEFHDMVMQGKFGVKTNALGIQLLSDASARGDIVSVLDIAADLQLAATEAGQSAQIFNVLKELKGVGSAWYMQKVVDRMNTKYADRIAAGKMQRISVDPALMAELAKATTVDQMAAAEEAVAKDVARQLPLTWDDRLSSWRYFSMLANPTTHIRNITGNLLMKGLNTAKDVTAIGVQRVAEKLGLASESDRVHALLNQADKNIWGDWVQQSYDEQARNLSGGSKLGFESFVKQNTRSFDTKWVNALAQFNFRALENEDIAFIRPAYKNALMQYMVAQGYTLNEKGVAGKTNAKGEFVEMTKAQQNAAIDWASQQAWKQTFRDASSLATMLNKISKENAVSRLLVEGVMPFKKTPINIAKRGIEYSPAGIIMGVAQLTNGVKKGKVTTAQAIDNLASGITGSALMALGVMLAKLGVIRAGGEKDKKLETYLEDTGDQTYAMKFGDKSINMSSIAPATIPLFMGVALNEMIEQGGDSLDLSTITDTIAGTLNPFMEMSFMSSLNSALKNYNANGIGGALGSTLMTAAQNYGSQYLPTLGGKVAQFLDPTRRTTKSDATSPVGGNMDYYWRSLVKKVPGAEATLQPDVDVWGRTDKKDSFGEWALDFANKFILPTNIKVTNRDAVDNELIRVVENTGVTDFLPSDGNKYFTVNKQKYTMNAKQYTQYSQERGQAAYAALKDTMASASYKMASDEQKASMLKKALDAAYKQVSNQWKEKLGAYDNK